MTASSCFVRILLALGMSASFGAARGAESGPLTNLPLLYDAGGKLIGPYLRGVTYIRHEGRLFQLKVELNGFYQQMPSMGFASADCSGDAYLFALTTPNIYVYKNEIYYPDVDVSRREIGSYKFYFNNPKGVCSPNPAPHFMDVSKAIVETKEVLGVSFPVREGPPR